LKHNKNTTNDTGHHGHTGPGPAMGAAAGGALGHHEGHTATGALLGGAAGHHHAATHPDSATRPAGMHDSNQMNAPGATTVVDGATIPAAGAVHDGRGSAKSRAGEKAFVGKLEHAAGTILCSSTLRAKGVQKEREAQALKVQAAELNAAERLEQEAVRRRERAVAHGAHPDVLHPMGHNDTTGTNQNAQNMTGTNPGAQNMTGSGPNTHDTAGINPNAQNMTGINPGAQNMTGVGPNTHDTAGINPNAQNMTGINPNTHNQHMAGVGAGSNMAGVGSSGYNVEGGPTQDANMVPQSQFQQSNVPQGQFQHSNAPHGQFQQSNAPQGQFQPSNTHQDQTYLPTAQETYARNAQGFVPAH